MSETDEQKRWLAVVTYRTEEGTVSTEHEIEELDEIDEIIEQGPSWIALDDIKITLQRDCGMGKLTVKEAEAMGGMLH